MSVMLLGLYGLLIFALIRLASSNPSDPRGWLGSLFVIFLVATFVIGAPSMALKAVGARPVKPGSHADVAAALARLAALADVPSPQLAISQSRVPNAFAVGVTPRRSTVAVTRGLLDTLTPRELEAVLAHELTHIANRDAFVVTSASVLPIAGAYLGRWRFEGYDFRKRERDWREYLAWPFLVGFGGLLYVVGGVLTLAISRYREFVADRGSALLTGAPEQLMSALQKLSDETTRIPRGDLRAMAGLTALCVVPPRPGGSILERDHPPLEKRLAALAKIARELGRGA